MKIKERPIEHIITHSSIRYDTLNDFLSNLPGVQGLSWARGILMYIVPIEPILYTKKIVEENTMHLSTIKFTYMPDWTKTLKSSHNQEIVVIDETADPIYEHIATYLRMQYYQEID